MTFPVKNFSRYSSNKFLADNVNNLLNWMKHESKLQ